jgi:hypothetical protein
MKKDGKITLTRQSDIDLLRGMDEKLDGLVSTMAVQCEKVVKLEKTVYGNGNPGHAQRIAKLEMYLWMGLGGLGVIQVLIQVWK